MRRRTRAARVGRLLSRITAASKPDVHWAAGRRVDATVTVHLDLNAPVQGDVRAHSPCPLKLNTSGDRSWRRRCCLLSDRKRGDNTATRSPTDSCSHCDSCCMRTLVELLPLASAVCNTEHVYRRVPVDAMSTLKILFVGILALASFFLRFSNKISTRKTGEKC